MAQREPCSSCSGDCEGTKGRAGETLENFALLSKPDCKADADARTGRGASPRRVLLSRGCRCQCRCLGLDPTTGVLEATAAAWAAWGEVLGARCLQLLGHDRAGHSPEDGVTPPARPAAGWQLEPARPGSRKGFAICRRKCSHL